MFGLKPPLDQVSVRSVPEPVHGEGDYWVITFDQIRSGLVTLERWPATSAGTYRDFGSDEVDFDYYPSWGGQNRILVMSPAEARGFGLSARELDVAN